MTPGWRLAAMLPLVGCVYVFDGDGGDHGGRPDADAPIPAPNTSGAFLLSPPGAAMGARAAVTLVDQGTPDLDLREVVEVRLRGAAPIEVTLGAAENARTRALSVVVGVEGRPGLADLELVRADGLRYRLDDAFVVVVDPADVPGAPWTGGDDTAGGTETDFPSDLDTPGDTPNSPGRDSCVLDTACDTGGVLGGDFVAPGDTDGRDTPAVETSETGVDTGVDTARDTGLDSAVDTTLDTAVDSAR